MTSVFNEQILAEKLSKLNNTQQCIETLSHWCIFHRSKAELVVATWDKQFHRAGMVEKVPLLYLANDILQNSKRNGNEFVSEFWKVLPSALKEMTEKGDGHGKIVVSRLVDIWEERRVFGSHAKNLKDVMLGDELPAPLEFKRKRSRSVKIFRRDSRTMRTKLTIGGTPEKIVTAFHLVLSEHRTEDEEMTKCKSAISRLRKMEEEVEAALNKKKDPKRKILAKDLEEEESILKHSVEKLKVVEANRVALVSQLREALHEQESELESVRTQMQVAQAHIEEAGNTWKHLDDENYVSVAVPASSTNPTTSKKTTAAEVADMLASSSSSQYIMSSVLSTFAAEEAKNAGLTSSTPATTSSSMPNNVGSSSSSSLTSEQMRVDPNAVMTANNNHHLPQNNNIYQIPSAATMHGQIPPNSQMSYPHPTSQHYLQQPSGAVVCSYGYGNLPPMPPPTVPPPPAPLSYMVSPIVSTQQSSQLTQQQQLQQQQPHNVANNQLSILNQTQLGSVPQFPPPAFRPLYPMPPPGMVYYAHPHQSQ